MTDICERLKEIAPERADGDWWYGDLYGRDANTILDAADEIERLRERTEELEADAAVHDEQLTRVARIRLDLESRNIKLEKLRDAVKADYCRGMDSKEVGEALAACEEQNDD